MVNLKIKKLHPDFELPSKGTPESAAWDLKAYSMRVEHTEGGTSYIEYGLGFSSEIPPGYCALLFPRSSQSNKDQRLANCVGVVDSDFRSEWKARFKLDVIDEGDENNFRSCYGLGDRIVQMLIVPVLEVGFELVDELSETSRGSGSFGHTGT